MNTVPAHVHDHAHHAGTHAAGGVRRGRLLVALGLTCVMLVVEVFGGIFSGSLALLADAGHMLVDSMALLLAFVGAWLATRPADTRRSYGYGRMEVLAGFVNALSQLVLVAWIIVEAVLRFMHPHAILPRLMFVVALAGLIVNVLVLWILHEHDEDDVNMAGAALHVLGDLLGSAAAVTAALLIAAFGWLWADPALSILVALLICNSAWRLLRRSAHILLEGVPEGMASSDVEASLRGIHPALRDVHHLHVWQLATGSRMATLHVAVQPPLDSAEAIRLIQQALLEQFNISHVTVQVEPSGCADRHDGCGNGHDLP